LDPDWRKAVHLSGEKVCHYLLASGKAGAADHYRDDRTFASVLPMVGEVCDRHADIQRKVDKAARTGIKARHLSRAAAPGTA
jgi:hypothetical protein